MMYVGSVNRDLDWLTGLSTLIRAQVTARGKGTTVLNRLVQPTVPGQTGLPREHKSSWGSFQFWIVLNMLDAVQTWVLLSMGGIEGNPFVAGLIHTFGPEQGLLLKVLLATMIGSALLRSSSAGAFKMLNLAMTGVVAWNLSVISQVF